MAVSDKPCRTCGEMMYEAHVNKLDCPECVKSKKAIGVKKCREYQKKYRKEYRARLAAEKKKPAPHKKKVESEYERIAKVKRDTSCDASSYF
jgi:predicted RNA-binding Zn-ribbon protein involved in translation (DUF1610 family)